MTIRSARVWHGVTAVVAIGALLLQVFLIVIDHQAVEGDPYVDRLTRFGRLVSYFTIQCNLLVAITCVQLARDPARDGPNWRALRIAAVVGITVTGVVHFFLLRGLSDLDGVDWFGDKLLHMVVPLLAVAGWAMFGPRPRVDGRAIGLAIGWPLVWLAWTLIMGAATGWYPYPFLDHREEDGVTGVVTTSIGITIFFLVLMAIAHWIDRRAKPVPEAGLPREHVTG